MELWIRSQDKHRLTIVRDLRMYYAKQNNVWVIEDCDDLGTYKTKERALKVLDEIHQRLIDIQSVEIMRYVTPSMKKRSADCVYIMPKE